MAAAAAAPCASRRSSRDSFKVLEADIRHANTLARGTTTGRACRCGCPTAHLPLPPAADRLQPRRRARPHQDPHLQGLCGRQHTTTMSTPLQKSQPASRNSTL